MRGRPIEHNENEVILNAQKVFWERGYAATSLNDLKDATQLGSSSLYNTFKGGKKELFSKAIQQRRADFNEFKHQLSQSKNPLALIKDFFYLLADANTAVHKRGCIIANSVTELAFIDAELEQEAIQILLDVEDMFTAAISHAQRNNIITTKTNARVLGRYLITVWNGLNVTRRMHPDAASLKPLIRLQLSVLS